MARARKEPVDVLVEDKPTDVDGLIAFMESLRATIPDDQRVSEEEIRNLDEHLYGEESLG